MYLCDHTICDITFCDIANVHKRLTSPHWWKSLPACSWSLPPTNDKHSKTVYIISSICKKNYDRFLEGAFIRLQINLLVLLVQWMDFDHLACPANSVPLNNWCFLLTVSFGSYSICSKADFDKQGFSPHTRKYWTKTEIIIVIRSQIKHRNNCECCPGHYLIVLITPQCHNSKLNRCLCSHCSQCLLVSTSVY